jgi:hypothetical protein
MQIPLIYYLINDFKKERFSNKDNKMEPMLLNVTLYYVFLVYISTMIGVYASVLCWDNTKGTLFQRLNYATLANIFSVFYLIYYFLFHR